MITTKVVHLPGQNEKQIEEIINEHLYDIQITAGFKSVSFEFVTITTRHYIVFTIDRED